MSLRISLVVLSVLLLFCLSLQFTNANNTDTFRPGQLLNTTDLIFSANGEFSLRFREMRDGISLCVVREISDEHVWIANREHPFVNSSAVLTFNEKGNLVISDGGSSRKVTNISAGNDTYAKLLDSGNLILTNKASVVLWQSFDYPSLMLLPGMKLKDAKTGWSFAPSKSNQDPAPGPFSLHLGSRKELILMNGSEPYWSSPIVDELAAIFVIDGEDVTWPRDSTNTTREIEFEEDGSLILWLLYTGDEYWYQYPLSKSTNANNTDTLRPGQSLNTTDLIFSANGEFSLRFREMRDGISLCVVREISDEHVWIANREHPFVNSSAVLTFNEKGNLVISDGGSSRKVTNISAGNDTYAKLLDSGNLILTNKASVVLWQSFDYPSLMLLPGMKLKDAKTGWSFAPSKSNQDPAPGPFSLHLGSRKELILMNGSEPYWSSPIVDDLAAIFVIDGEDVTWPRNSTNTTREIQFEEDGSLNLWLYTGDGYWEQYSLSKCAGNDSCPLGHFQMCNETTGSLCDCLPGFNHRNRKCVRKNKLQCSDRTNVQHASFLRISRVVPPTYPQLLHVDNTSDCKSACLRNCSCTGYAFDQEDRCLVWYNTLVNLKQLSATDIVHHTDFYLKLAIQDIPEEYLKNPKVGGNNKKRKSAIRTASIVIVVTMGFFVTTGIFVYHVRRKSRRKGEDLLLLDFGMTQKANTMEHGDSRKRDAQMPLFSFASVCAATNNFSAANKLGEGGFGPVYKGTLLKGDEVAIKRLSKRSRQGLEELKNEATLIAKIQHKNLVRLLGCCIEQDEKILVYEYLPNKSLDFFLFDVEMRRVLDWGTRVQIVEGIAQGLAYLHQYSRLKIIHRDLKPSNILLDSNMNPKISDFGMARIFREDELQASTNRIVGTHGYMPPEYILEGLYSIKFDVFSFGILLLEIVSGRKSIGFYQIGSQHLIRYVWELWTNDNGVDLVDPLLDNIPSIHMILRYVNIALLCIQESAEDRPTMSDVVTMLSNENVILPYPKEPAFLNVRGMQKMSPVNKPETCSMNDVTVSIMEGR